MLSEKKKLVNVVKGVPNFSQLVNYLNVLKREIGLLINFGPTGVEVKRKYCKPEGSN